ncbi:MAG: hypothetical protein R3247_16550, partial [Rhodothermales bacterium]|nr:hypothetical protein [Rhodothermales bacterium]
MNEYPEEFAPELDEAYAEDAFDEAELAAGDGAAGETAVLGEGAVELAGEEAFFPRWPWLVSVSGTYGRRRGQIDEEVRVDIDGRYPQYAVSGTVRMGLSSRVDWAARVRRTGTNTWAGAIFYKDGALGLFPYTAVRVRVYRSIFSGQRRVVVTYSGPGIRRSHLYVWRSGTFRDVEFEFDTVAGTTAITAIQTHDHPNRPPGLPSESLSIERVFERAGYRVAKSGGDGIIPIAGAGPNARWSDMEMHDAMQAYWSRFANQAQWSMWVLFAALHESGTSLGGIMFDDIGPNHRQGTALFNDSFINNAPGGDASPAAWVRRMKFWTACHEMGHAFNLAHSWQKSLGTAWMPLSDEPEARSFMNYPFRVSGGQNAFFSDFEYRFSDGELLFMRHAPERFVQMGNADWFDHHGFEQARIAPEPRLKLHVRLHRDLGHFEFMEPVIVELKLENVSGEAQLVDEKILEETDHLTVILKKRGGEARQWVPFARRCYTSKKTALNDGEALYGSLYLASGLNGWDLAEPGVYQIQVALHHHDEDIVSDPLTIRVAPPRSYDEEFLAQDFFSEDVGRTLAFNGSLYLGQANDTLREVAGKLSDRRVAHHCRLALGNPYTRDYKQLVLEGGRRGMTSVQDDDGAFRVKKAQPDEARDQLMSALLEEPKEAV